MTPGGVVATLAGLAGSSGSTDGTGSAARFKNPANVAVDSAGNVYVADAGNSTIRKVTPGGVVTTIGGLAGSNGSTDGTGSAARFNYPVGVAVDSVGNVYVGDYYNHTIRQVTPGGVVTTLAGLAGSNGSTDGMGSAARFNNPRGVAVDSAGIVYVADCSNHTIRKGTTLAPVITSQHQSQTVTAGATATFSVLATGSGLTYQWRKDGVAISGANASSYSITGAQASHVGSYTVVVSNTAGSVTSSAADLILSGLIMLPTVVVDGIAGRSYRLEFKNTVTDTGWTPLVTTNLPAARLFYTDISATNQPKRFYRVVPTP